MKATVCFSSLSGITFSAILTSFFVKGRSIRVVKTLNIRVDTARDLVFKLYTTTDDMVRNAYLTELLLVYANRYRGDMDVDRGLSKTEMLYFRGEYEESFTLVLKVLE